MIRFLPFVASLCCSSAAFAQLVVVDPGHGGSDAGAVGCGLYEKDLALDIALHMADRLQENGLQVAMTRSDDQFIALADRTAFANERGASRYISVHLNSNSGTAGTGTETYTAPSASNNSTLLANALQNAMIDTWGLRNRGVKTAAYYVLKNTNMPATLVETSFINNCGDDYAMHSDPDARYELALALADAATIHLGLTPAAQIQPGQLKGSVYEDLGEGEDDMSVRLPGAVVQLNSGDAQTASGSTASWNFSLDPGSYTVTATKSGYVTTSRRCEVQSNQTTWCSIGMKAVANQGGTTTNPGTTTTHTGTTTNTGTTTHSSSSGLSCSSTPASKANPWGVLSLLSLLMLALFRKKAFVAALALVLLPQWARAECVERPVEGQLKLDAQLVKTGHWLAPVLSPDGAYAAIGDLDHQLWVIPILDASKKAFVLAQGENSGLHPEWQADSKAVAYRAPHQSAWAVPYFAKNLEGLEQVPKAKSQAKVFVKDEQFFIKQQGQKRALHQKDERLITAIPSPCGQKTVLWALDGTLTLVDNATGERQIVGKGSSPSFSPSGRWMMYERTEDDGEQITDSQIFLVKLDSKGAQPAIFALQFSKEGLNPRFPNLNDEGVLLFTTEQGLWRAQLDLQNLSNP